MIARDPERAEVLRSVASDVQTRFVEFGQAEAALEGASVVINASPLGMVGAEPMPGSLIGAVRRHAARVTIFDLVTTPVETEFLVAGRSGGGIPIDGLTMLVGQAARAFELFFGVRPPPPDNNLRNLLVSKGNQ